jgi:hypothetical protein
MSTPDLTDRANNFLAEFLYGETLTRRRLGRALRQASNRCGVSAAGILSMGVEERRSAAIAARRIIACTSIEVDQQLSAYFNACSVVSLACLHSLGGASADDITAEVAAVAFALHSLLIGNSQRSSAFLTRR